MQKSTHFLLIFKGYGRFCNFSASFEDFSGTCDVHIQTLFQTCEDRTISIWSDDIDSLPEGSSIALFIDGSGSMTQANVQASYDAFVAKLNAKNITITTVTNSDEVVGLIWVTSQRNWLGW